MIILPNTACAAADSLTTVRIRFITRSSANLLRLTGWVFEGIPQVGSGAAQNYEPQFEPITIPSNRLQLESYKSPAGLSATSTSGASASGTTQSNRVTFGFVDTLKYPSVQYNASEILLVPLYTPQPPLNGLVQADLEGVAANY